MFFRRIRPGQLIVLVFLGIILLGAGSLLGTLQLPAQGRPAALGHELAQSPARESAAGGTGPAAPGFRRS